MFGVPKGRSLPRILGNCSMRCSTSCVHAVVRSATPAHLTAREGGNTIGLSGTNLVLCNVEPGVRLSQKHNS